MFDKRDDLQAKRKHLTGKMLKMMDLRDECLATGDEIDAVTASDMTKAIEKVRKQLDALDRVAQEGDITDEMVETAREVDVSTLIDFVGGRSVGFCHNGDNPTMLARLPDGKAYCHKCQKVWNAIDVLTIRDGYSFQAAVRSLCSSG